MFKSIGCFGLLILGLVAFVGFNTYNELVERDEAVSTAWSQVENVYQRRADLIPNLVETVRGAADFERGTLEAVVEARSRATGIVFESAPTGEDLARFEEAQSDLAGALSRLLVVAENYPELGATEAFRDLQSQLEGAENRIAVGFVRSDRD